MISNFLQRLWLFQGHWLLVLDRSHTICWSNNNPIVQCDIENGPAKSMAILSSDPLCICAVCHTTMSMVFWLWHKLHTGKSNLQHPPCMCVSKVILEVWLLPWQLQGIHQRFNHEYLQYSRNVRFWFYNSEVLILTSLRLLYPIQSSFVIVHWMPLPLWSSVFCTDLN